jgi:hypothetical protein
MIRNETKTLYNNTTIIEYDMTIKQSESAKERHKLHPELHPMKGKHHSEKSNLKNSESHKGKDTWNKGTIGICKPNSGSFGNGKHPWNFGLTKETDIRVKINAENNVESHIGKINDGCGNNFGTGNYYVTPNQGSVFMRSSWELFYAKYLDDNKINYLYEPHSFKMIINNKNTTYRPDFYLMNENKFVEIKGYFRDEISKQKTDKFKELYSKYYNYEILFKEELKNLGIKL